MTEDLEIPSRLSCCRLSICERGPDLDQLLAEQLGSQKIKDGDWSDEMDSSQHSSELGLHLPLSGREEEEEDDESQLFNIALGLPWMLSRSQDPSPQFPSIRPDRPIDPTRLSLPLQDIDQALRRLEADIGQDDPKPYQMLDSNAPPPAPIFDSPEIAGRFPASGRYGPLTSTHIPGDSVGLTTRKCTYMKNCLPLRVLVK